MYHTIINFVYLRQLTPSQEALRHCLFYNTLYVHILLNSTHDWKIHIQSWLFQVKVVTCIRKFRMTVQKVCMRKRYLVTLRFLQMQGQLTVRFSLCPLGCTGDTVTHCILPPHPHFILSGGSEAIQSCRRDILFNKQCLK